MLMRLVNHVIILVNLVVPQMLVTIVNQQIIEKQLPIV